MNNASLETVKIKANDHAAKSGKRTAIIIINGYAGWIDADELPGYTSQFGNEIVHSMILPASWILANSTAA